MDLESMLELVRTHMSSVRTPGVHDKVYKEECMFTFDTPESDGGLYVNLSTFQGFGEQYVDLDNLRTGQVLYLHQKWERVPLQQEDQDMEPTAPSKLALGVEGGFQTEEKKYNINKLNSLAIMPARLKLPLPCPELPEKVLQAISAIIAHEGAIAQQQVAVWEEDRKVSKYAKDLPQLNNGVKIPPDPKQWKCGETGVTENLWLNLSTGFIGSGRQHWDGSGGAGSALRHYEQTGRQYPLVVKLGTITPHGADVYSYAEDENDMVEDPYLAEHLQHWGINMMSMQKTEKTMAELQIHLNISFEFDKLTEAGSQLKPLRGPGLVGLVNLGNSCYVNSVLQLMWSVPNLKTKYVDCKSTIFTTAPAEPQDDLPTQMAKLGVALVEGQTGAPPPLPTPSETQTSEQQPLEPPPLAVRPQLFKALVAKGHAEFATAHQQDAVEYLQHLLDRLTRAEHNATGRLGQGGSAANTAALFNFEMEDRVQCLESGRVSYRKAVSNVLGLEIPLEAAVNKQEIEDYKEREQKRQKLKASDAAAYIGQQTDDGMTGGGTVMKGSEEEPVIPRVPFSACLDRLVTDELMSDYFSAALGRTGAASKGSRMATFPPYLIVQMRRYYVDTDWTPKKMEVLVDVPEHLDLAFLRGKGPQPHESLQPEEAPTNDDTAAAAAAPAQVQPDPEIVSQLTAMGFSENGSRRAAVATNNASAEASMEWVLSHMGDPDFNDPLPETGPSEGEVSAESVSMLLPMGFTEEQAAAALMSCGGNVERAADWLFSHMDDLDAAVAQVNGSRAEPAAAGAASVVGSALMDGGAHYTLVGFVSHMGRNTACGHYVTHIKKDGVWVIFNDEKVAESEHPPKDLGYLYMFKRDDFQE